MLETTDIPIQPIKSVVVCGHCLENFNQGVSIEWNFKDKMVYFYCPKCNKMNEMGLRSMVPQPLPRAGISR